MILNRAMPSEIYAIFSLSLVSFVLSHERHILVLSFVILIIFSLLSPYSIIGMVRDNWTPLGSASLREGLCSVIQYHQVLSREGMCVVRYTIPS